MNSYQRFMNNIDYFCVKIKDKKFRVQYFVRTLFKDHSIQFDYKIHALLFDYNAYFNIPEDAIPAEVPVILRDFEMMEDFTDDQCYVVFQKDFE